MNREQIAAAVANAVGNPSSGAVADVLSIITDAIDAELNPKAKVEARILAVPEKR